MRSKRFFDLKEQSGKAEREVRRMMWLCVALITCHLSLITSCSQKDDTIVIQSQRHWVEKTVAVVAPLSDISQKMRLERTAQWFLDNFHEAQLYDTLAVSLKLEWYDEQTEDLTTLSQRLAGRDDIMAIIGPFDNDALGIFAPACQQTLKPLITPTATAEDIIRRYAVTDGNNNPFLWALTRTDVKMTETLMSSYAALCQTDQERPSVSANLLAPANSYGQTFSYWAPFFAENYDINLINNLQYNDDAELFEYIRSYIIKAGPDAGNAAISGTFTVIESVKQLYDIARLRRHLIFERMGMARFYDTTYDDPAMDQLWQFFESFYGSYYALNNLCEEKIEALGVRAYPILQGYKGFSPYADPTTGFELSYLNRFGVRPLFAECKFYDALLLSAFAACYSEHHPQPSTFLPPPSSLNDAIVAITSVADQESQLSGAAWNATSMEIYLSAMERGNLLHFKGASGDIAFDPESYTTAAHTTYVQWEILDGQIHHRAYIGDTGSRRIGNSYAAWQYLYDLNTAEKDFDEQTAGGAAIQYPALTDQYAVLVQGSMGFENYRHQADVLSVYQLLRRGGFDDDHIILIIDATMVNDTHNREPGIVRAEPGGPDLLGGSDGLPAAIIDYDAASLTAADISSILLGEQSSRLPIVLPKDAGQNVFLFWSGHGRTGEFSWRNAGNGNGFTSDMMRQTAQQMAGEDHFRKLFVVAESCYSESVVRPLEGIQGVLAITGASGSEQSWADNWSPTLLVWMSDRFSQNFVKKLSENPKTSYRDLFLYCAEHTLGSHAKIVNAGNFGNLYSLNPSEFIVTTR